MSDYAWIDIHGFCETFLALNDEAAREFIRPLLGGELSIDGVLYKLEKVDVKGFGLPGQD